MDPRHLKRIKIIQNLYAQTFHNVSNNLPYPADTETKKILKNLSEIDNSIGKYASKFPLDKISKTDLAILRWAVFELNKKKLPTKVIINEAIELAKELSGEKSFAFVNAILGKILIDNEQKN
jgi:N utilization substance protein B